MAKRFLDGAEQVFAKNLAKIGEGQKASARSAKVRADRRDTWTADVMIPTETRTVKGYEPDPEGSEAVTKPEA